MVVRTLKRTMSQLSISILCRSQVDTMYSDFSPLINEASQNFEDHYSITTSVLSVFVKSMSNIVEIIEDRCSKHKKFARSGGCGYSGSTSHLFSLFIALLLDKYNESFYSILSWWKVWRIISLFPGYSDKPISILNILIRRDGYPYSSCFKCTRVFDIYYVVLRCIIRNLQTSSEQSLKLQICMLC